MVKYVYPPTIATMATPYNGYLQKLKLQSTCQRLYCRPDQVFTLSTIISPKVGHDRRGHGRSQTADGHDLDHYADDPVTTSKGL